MLCITSYRGHRPDVFHERAGRRYRAVKFCSLRLGNRRAVTISRKGRCLGPGPSSLHRDNSAKGNCYEQSHCEGCYESQGVVGERRHDPPRAGNFPHENEISGAPVLDGCGKLVGVVSLTDIALSEAERAAIEHEQSPSGLNPWKKRFNREDLSGLHLEESGLLVRDIMTRAAYTIPEALAVSEIAKTMGAEYFTARWSPRITTWLAS